jgi:bifunctional DNA-binding transcriptional regulator/antitoxin component of YhaV-PrlF toxin-antitoxin module
MQKVKQRRRRTSRPSSGKTTRISAKNQATLPVDVLRRAGLRAGDQVRVKAEGAGRVVIESARHAIRRWAGSLTGAYDEGYLRKLRREWR